jgi:hypothetical protein
MAFQLYRLARPFCRASASIDWVTVTSGRFVYIFRFSSTISVIVGITIKDGLFYPAAITVAIRIYIFIIKDAR